MMTLAKFFIQILFFWVFLILLNFAPNMSVSATVEPYSDIVMGCDILVSGEIELGDAEKLSKVIANISDDHSIFPVGRRVCFNSAGGNMAEALAIAEVIARSQRGTAVAERHECKSACALAFMAGWYTLDYRVSRPDRVIHPTGALGFHSPRLQVPDDRFSKEEVEKAFRIAISTISEVSRLRSQGTLHIPESLIFEMLQTPYSQMKFVQTVEEASRWKISIAPVGLFDGGKSQVVSNICLNVARGLHDTQNPSHFSSEQISEEVLVMISDEKEFRARTLRGFDVEQQSGLPCFVDIYRRDKYPAFFLGAAKYISNDNEFTNWTGWDNVWSFHSFPGETNIEDLPSDFNRSVDSFFHSLRVLDSEKDIFQRPEWCQHAKTSTEKKVCSSSALSGIDIEISRLYKKYAKKPGIKELARTRLFERNSCQDDAECILEVTEKTRRLFLRAGQ